ncbi:MAG: acyltransferase [Bacteriovoracaceae bacterium]|nr:acyltransferase [Bacteriovoracaceae bacterium]
MFKFITKSFLKTFEQKSIPSLDGIRALSCVLVILGHLSYLYVDFFTKHLGHTWGTSLAFAIGNQYAGVTFFFVLSGFLITNILLTEIKRTGVIDFRTFFLKRVFRIFPAYYFYFFAIVLFYQFNQWTTYSSQDVWSILTYTHNYFSDKNPWHLGHFWSLAVEEQFYIFWPIVFLLSYRKMGIKLPILIVLISPLLRVMTYFLFPDLRGRISIMTHTRMDSLLIGCALAYLYQANHFLVFYNFIKKYKLHFLAFLQIFFFSRIFNTLFKGAYNLTLGFTLDELSMCVLIVFLTNKENILFKWFNNPIVIHLGVLSYSIYLWQMPFVWKELGMANLVLRIVGIYVCALLSFIFVESPFMELRKKMVPGSHTN